LKVWVAFPLNTKWSYLVFGIRPGVANQDEEIASHREFLHACRRHPGFVVLAADGATKERSQLRSLVVNAWKEVGHEPPRTNPHPFTVVVDMDHLQKSLLSAILYGGRAPPHGDVGVADPFPLFKTSMSLGALRPNTWVSSDTPHLFL
jgi:hypothetical protein